MRPRLLMSWQRRFQGADAPFFDGMGSVGLKCTHLGQKVYDITAAVGGADPITADVYANPPAPT